MSTIVDAGTRLPHRTPGPVGPDRARGGSPDEQPEDAVALLQAYQAARITTGMIEDAERRLRRALQSAQHGTTADAGLLLRQLATDLGITLSLA